MKRTTIAAIAIVLSYSTLHAQVPQMINYQGRAVVGSTTFDGSGQFKFALVDTAGTTTFWSNDNTSVSGSEPTSSVSLSVTKGLYSVLLGDTSLTNMTAIPNSVFNNSDVRLRVWFNDGTHGSELLAPDQRIAAVGYAVTAATASLANTAQASGLIGSVAIANGGTGSTSASGARTNLGAAATASDLSQFAPTTSLQLAGVTSDETGTGALVFGTSPTLTTPSLGVATATSINKISLTAPVTGATLSLANGSTLATAGAFSITLAAIGPTNLTLPTNGTLTTTANNLGAFAATTSAQLASVTSDETGNGSLVFANFPTLTTPNITGTMNIQGASAILGGDFSFSFIRPANTTGAGAAFNISGQSAGGLNNTGGHLVLNGGNASGTGTDGQVLIGLSNTSGVTITPNTSVNGVMTANGGITANNGTASAPSYSFSNDTNTGMFTSTADTLNFATGGTPRMSINPAGVISGDGSGLTLGQSATTVLGTSTLSVANTAARTLIPGLTQTYTVPVGGRAYFETEGGVQTLATTATGFSHVLIEVFIDGLASAANQREIIAANNGGINQVHNYWHISGVLNLGGSHTIEVRAGGGSTTGGATASVSSSGGFLQGKLTIIILKQ